MTAIYARQSVERVDSISIDMQVEYCKRLSTEGNCRVYTDRGFSGTTTARPAFQEMLEAVEQGEIREVLVYKLDRISRSLCDFAGMMQTFRQHGVTLRSFRESFDTQTEIGGMLLNLLMMFAELEQKTIAGRVRDNYYARAVQQMALGGVAPYGYKTVPILLQGHKTTTLTPVPEEAAQVLWLYTRYGLHGENVEQLVHECNQRGSRTRQGADWSNSGVIRILRNPVYVQGNLRCVSYFREQGAVLDHPWELYCKGNGCLVYGDKKARKGAKLTQLEGEHIAAGLHPGLVEPALWLAVQERLASRGGSTNRGTGHHSWLQGTVVCGLCGTRCYARNNGAGARYTYFVCRGKRLGLCDGIPALRTETVEEAVAPVLARQAELLLPLARTKTPDQPDPNAAALEELDGRMQRLAAAMGEPSAAMPFLREELERLAAERAVYTQRLRRVPVPQKKDVSTQWNTWWEQADLEQRRRATGLLVQEVRVFPERIEIKLR